PFIDVRRRDEWRDVFGLRRAVSVLVDGPHERRGRRTARARVDVGLHARGDAAPTYRVRRELPHHSPARPRLTKPPVRGPTDATRPPRSNPARPSDLERAPERKEMLMSNLMASPMTDTRRAWWQHWPSLLGLAIATSQ